jgi:hypothetical protein
MGPPDSASASPYLRWYRHFFQRRDETSAFPWHDNYSLSAAERRVVARCVQQFQLGEWARGRGFRRRASQHDALSTDPWFLPSLDLFIQEEQTHSNLLGRFMDQQGIPRLSGHWVDSVFRRLRKLAGLDMCAAVLVTAEVLAMPFYQALRDSTHSALLRAICAKILIDEAAHLNYQGLTLGLIRRGLTERAKVVRAICHRALFASAALIVWHQHRMVFRAAGWGFFRYWNEAERWFAILEMWIRNISLAAHYDDSFAEARLD